jgi:hypothetical protein
MHAAQGEAPATELVELEAQDGSCPPSDARGKDGEEERLRKLKPAEAKRKYIQIVRINGSL